MQRKVESQVNITPLDPVLSRDKLVGTVCSNCTASLCIDKFGQLSWRISFDSKINSKEKGEGCGNGEYLLHSPFLLAWESNFRWLRFELFKKSCYLISYKRYMT